MDVQEARRLLSRIRASLPQEMEQAQQIQERGEGIVSKAISTADQIRTAAERQSRTLVEETAVVQAAHSRAEEVLAQARRQAQTIVAEAKREAEGQRQQGEDYARLSLEEFLTRLNELQQQVSHGIDVYQARRGSKDPKDS